MDLVDLTPSMFFVLLGEYEENEPLRGGGARVLGRPSNKVKSMSISPSELPALLKKWEKEGIIPKEQLDKMRNK